MKEDLAVFFDDFAETAKIDGLEVLGIFDEAYSPVFPGSISEGKTITLLVPSDKVPFVEHNIEIEMRDRVFEVVEIQPIDDGKLTYLILKELD